MDLFNLMATIGLDSTAFDEGLNSVKDKASSLGNIVSGGFKTAGVAIAAVGTAALAAGGAIVKGAGDVASYGDNIDKMSQKMGISAQAYQEWDAVLQHSGTSIDSMSRGMQTLQKNAISSADKFEKLGISQEQLASMSTEDLFSATITGLQNMGEGAERTALASELLGGSAKELGALLNTSAEDTQAMRDRVNELGGVMSDDAVKAAAAYQDSLQDMQTAFSGLSRNLMGSFMPSITAVMDGLTEIFSGNFDEGIAQISEGVDEVVNNIIESAPKVLEGGAQIIENLAMSIIENIPKIFPALTELVMQVGQSLISQLPTIAAAGIEIITEVASGIIDGLPSLIETMLDVGEQLIDSTTDGVGNNLSKMLDSGVQMVSKLADGFLENLPAMIQTVTNVLTQVISFIGQNYPKFIQSGLELVGKIADGFFKNLPAMIQTVTKFLTQTITFISQNFPKFVESGLQLLGKIAEGFIKNLPEITKAVVQMIAQLVSTIAQNLPQILQQGIVIIGKLVAGLIQAIPQVVAAIPKIISSIVDTFGQYDWLSIGKNIIGGIANGITNGLGLIKDAAVNAAKTAFNNAKDFLEIASPSKLMRDKVGRYISEGIAVGIEDNLNSITNSMNDVADLVSQPIDVGEVGMAGGSGPGNAYNSSNSVVINVYGAVGQNVNELAEIVSRKINASVNRRGAAWA